MTSSFSLFKVMGQTKVRRINWLIILELIATVVTTLWTAISGNFSSVSLFYAFCSWAIFPYLIGVILVAIVAEKAYTSDTYRLIPISNWKFYAMNLLSSLAAFIYLVLVQVVLYALTAAIGWSSLSDSYEQMQLMMSQYGMSFNFWAAAGTILGLSLVINILAWSTISLIHLVMNSASNFLPKARQRVVNIIVYVIVIFLTLRIVTFLFGWLSNLMYTAFGSSNIDSLWLGILVMVVAIVLESALNIVMINKWVETNPN